MSRAVCSGAQRKARALATMDQQAQNQHRLSTTFCNINSLIEKSGDLVGGQVNNVMANVILITALLTVVIGLVVLVLWWSVSRKLIFDNWKFFVLLLAPSLFTVILKLIVNKVLMDSPTTYRYPYAWR